jgi:hypothetical protein
VGKGRGNRGFYQSGHGVHCPNNSERILIQEYPSEADAFAAEKFLITYYGRKDLSKGCLRKQTDGGEGVSGLTPTEAHRRNMSIAATGRKLSDETRHKISEKLRLLTGDKNSFFGKRHSEGTRHKIQEAGRRQTMTVEMRRKIGNASRIDLTGQTFNRWTVLGLFEENTKKWRCRCECGTQKNVRGSSLRGGIRKSCGCIQSPWPSPATTAKAKAA